MVTCLYSVHQWPVISIFAPVGKTVGLKSDSYLLELSQSPLSLCKLWGGGDQTMRTGRRCENMVFFVCRAWSACAWGT